MATEIATPVRLSAFLDPTHMSTPRAACALAALIAILPIEAAQAQRTAKGAVPDFTILQINDIYRVNAVRNGTEGGLGRVSSVVARARRETRAPVFTMLAGDFLAPSLESRYFAGLQMIDALNFLHDRAPLLVVPGNHEFDDRRSTTVVNAVKASRFSWVVSNLVVQTRDSMVDRRFATDTIVAMGKVKVGVFGLSIVDEPRDYVRADRDFARIAEEHITKLERAGADVILALTHLNMPDDRRVAALRKTHPKFVWIVGGHEHYLQGDAMTDSTALITKGDANARRIWRVGFTMNAGAATLRADSVALDSTVAIDMAYKTTVEDRYAAEMRKKIPFFDQQIGAASSVLDGREETVRNAESTWGNYLTDVMRGAFVDVATDMAVINGGALRVDDAWTGTIRWEHLARTFGFPARVGLVWLTGRDLKQHLLERSVGGEYGDGRFLQVSGVRFAFDRRKAAGARVSDVRFVRGDREEALDEGRVYIVAMTDYIYNGGDGYLAKANAKLTIPPGPDLRLMVFDALANAFARGESIAPKIEGRIVEQR